MNNLFRKSWALVTNLQLLIIKENSGDDYQLAQCKIYCEKYAIRHMYLACNTNSVDGRLSIF